MRSKIARRLGSLLLVAASFAGPSCQTQDDRVRDLCKAIDRCTGYVPDAECREEIEDALRDRRLSPAALTQCASCLRANSDDSETGSQFDDCQGLFLDRACDTACRDVALVTSARTSKAMRTEACGVVSTACTLSDCEKDFFPELGTIAEAQAADRTIADCVACIASVPASPKGCPDAGAEDAGTATTAGSSGAGGCGNAGSSGAAGASGTGAGGSGGMAGGAGTQAAAGSGGAAGSAVSELDSERCSRFVERCSAACLGVAAVDKRLTLAAAAAKYCVTPEECPTESNGGGGEGGAGAQLAPPSAAAGTAGTPECPPAPQTKGCFENAIQCGGFRDSAGAISAENPRDCLSCLETSMCREECATCEGLFK